MKDENNGGKKGGDNKITLFEKLRGIKGIKFLILGLAFGIILLFIGSLSEKNDTVSESHERETGADSAEINKYMREYIDAAELELRMLIENISGVSNVRVMITLECLSECVYAKNRAGEGIYTYATVLNSDRSEDMVLVKEVAPKIRGVGVVCGGGGNPEKQAEIIDICRSLFGIPSSRVSVAEGK